MSVTNGSSGQPSLDHFLISSLNVHRSHCRQNSFAQAGPDVASHHAVVVLASLLSYSWLHSCLKPAIEVLVERDLCSFQVTAQVAFAQLLREVGLRFPHGAVDRSVVVVAFIGFAIAAEINPDEPSAVASCDDLANFASHRVSSLARNRGTHVKHYRGMKPRTLS